jgi:hypothetical protein
MMKTRLTEEQKKEFALAGRRTWEVIGFDVLQAVAEDQKKNVNYVSMKRAEVIEVVLDADHMLAYGRLKDPILLEFLKNGEYTEKIKLLKSAFSDREGM